MAIWPASLPQLPNRENFSDVPQDTTIRSPMDGSTKQRPRFTAQPHDVTEQYTITKAQVDTFLVFHESNLTNGALQFTKPDFLYGGTSEYIMVAPYELTPESPDIYRLRLTMEKLP